MVSHSLVTFVLTRQYHHREGKRDYTLWYHLTLVNVTPLPHAQLLFPAHCNLKALL